jgi:hypothetical protein
MEQEHSTTFSSTVSPSAGETTCVPYDLKPPTIRFVGKQGLPQIQYFNAIFISLHLQVPMYIFNGTYCGPTSNLFIAVSLKCLATGTEYRLVDR